jgi:hypothetical protein
MASGFRQLFNLTHHTVPVIFLGWGFLGNNHSMELQCPYIEAL